MGQRETKIEEKIGSKSLFRKLISIQEDGTVLMSKLFDMAYQQVYSNDLNEFVACTIGNGACDFSAQDPDGNFYLFQVTENLELRFWGNNTPLHFNQFPLYKLLIESGIALDSTSNKESN